MNPRMNPHSRRAALHAIAAVAVLASLNALAHSYIGLYGWATTHGLTGWQAATWPAEIDVFLIIGELALYIAYLDLWPTRHKIWPWATAVVGLAISVAGNVGHVRPGAVGSVDADRMTAATSPLAAFAGLAIALLVLKLTRPSATPSPAPAAGPATDPVTATALLLLAGAASRGSAPAPTPAPAPTSPPPVRPAPLHSVGGSTAKKRQPAQGIRAVASHPETDAGNTARDMPAADSPQSRLLGDARAILAKANSHGIRLTQRVLAAELRHRGHKVPNAELKHISAAIGLAALPPSGTARSPVAETGPNVVRQGPELSGQAGPRLRDRAGGAGAVNSFAQLTRIVKADPILTSGRRQSYRSVTTGYLGHAARGWHNRPAPAFELRD